MMLSEKRAGVALPRGWVRQSQTMPVRVDVVYSKAAHLGWTETITCPSCQQRWKAGVKVSGVGTGSAPYGVGREAARERAGIEAFSNASEEGERLIRLAKCPGCGHRQASGFSLMGVGGGFVLALFAGSVPGLLAERFKVMGLVSCVVIPGAWYAFARWDQQRNRAEADRRVVFERLPAS